MARRDTRLGLMITGYHALLASVPTELERGPHGPLTAEEIGETVALMDRLGAELAAERDAHVDE